MHLSSITLLLLVILWNRALSVKSAGEDEA